MPERKLSVPGCVFCSPDASRVIHSDGNFYIMLSLGPVVEGYSLLVSRAHFDCCANIPSSHRGEFLYLKKQVRRLLGEIYGACLFYEHGRVGTSLTIADSNILCYHAHLHCVPTGADMQSEISSCLEPLPLASWEQLHDIYMEHGEYLYLEDSGQNQYAYIVNKSIPRQFLRRVLAKLTGHLNRANWREYQGYPLVYTAKKKLEKAMSETLKVNS